VRRKSDRVSKPLKKTNRRLSAKQLQEYVLDDATEAIKLAEPFKFVSGQIDYNDPWPKIDPSLLSADDIIEYVRKTGMIFPFSAKQDEKKPRLKAASYEGRIGKNAYIFDNDKYELKHILNDGDKKLKIPANSIVFVECDIDFRLPPFIAVRFNLQINHVHRGLLLGTGPLVDPCFWGKLCIPLHNLTNAEYEIPLEEGLIWIEFTKMTSMPKAGRPPNNSEFWDIKKFIDKAAKKLGTNEKVAIRSSIPDATKEATERAQIASESAEQSKTAVELAKDEVDKAKTLADNAKKASETARNWGIAAAVGLTIGVVALWTTFYIEMHSQHKQMRPQLDSAIAENAELKERIRVLEEYVSGQSTSEVKPKASKSKPKKEPVD
jgi:deoxycytidine triphosphate deaminase